MARGSKLFLAWVGVLTVVGTVAGESTPEALQWLGRMADVFQGEAFRYGYEVQTTVTDVGQSATVTLRGTSTQSDRTHLRVEATMEISTSGEEPPMKANLLGVSDGAVLWVEADDPTGGGTQVIRMPLDKLEQIADRQPWARNFTRMDPVAQIEELARLFDFSVTDKTEEAVTLRAEVAGEGLEVAKEMFPGADPASLTELVLVISATTGFPEEMRVGSDPEVMVMRFTEPERLGKIDDSLFSYSPPEGVVLTDLGALIEDSP